MWRTAWQREPVRRRHRAERDHPLREAADRGASRRRSRAGRCLPRRSPRSPCGRRARAGRARPRPRARASITRRRPAPGTSAPDPCQPSWRPSASCTSAMPGPAKPAGRRAHRARVAGEAVDVVGLRPASAIARERRLAGEVQVGAEEPAADLPTARRPRGSRAARAARSGAPGGAAAPAPRSAVCFGGARAWCGALRRSGGSGSKRGSAISSLTFRT